jgi:hypothetical protein
MQYIWRDIWLRCIVGLYLVRLRCFAYDAHLLLYGEIEILRLASWPKAIVPSLMGVSLARLLLNLFQSAKQLHNLIPASKHNYVLRRYKHRKEMDEIVI